MPTIKFFRFLLLVFLTGCSLSKSNIAEEQPIDVSRLPAANLSMKIPNLSICMDGEDKSIKLDSNSPLTILVHGCDASVGQFRSLAQLYAFHGQQAICYSYDDRDSLVASADKLSSAIEAITSVTENKDITIIGHSMGGLIARKAVEAGNNHTNKFGDKTLNLITISAPVSGIEAASHCAIKPLHWLSAGIIPGICWLITGDNWNEITHSSNFITKPKPLKPSVKKYLKIVTDEKNTCRRESSDGRCLESDYVFSLPEQYHSSIDNTPNVTNIQVNAGHVEIVGTKYTPPRKLLSILQEHDILPNTPSKRKQSFENLMTDLYQLETSKAIYEE